MSQLSHKIIENLWNDFLPDQAKPVKPIMLVSYGPPGSGKSSLLKKVFPYFNHDEHVCHHQLDSFIRINVDDIINRFDEFTNVTSEQLEMYKHRQISFNQMIDSVSNIYFELRPEADTISTDFFMRSILSKYNIIYETTGNNIDWLSKDIKLAKENGYLIYLFYPFVPKLADLQKRAIVRAKKEGRYPGKKFIETSYIKALENFPETVMQSDRSIFFENPLNEEPVVLFSYDMIINQNIGLEYQYKCSRELQYILRKFPEKTQMFFENKCHKFTQFDF